MRIGESISTSSQCGQRTVLNDPDAEREGGNTRRGESKRYQESLRSKNSFYHLLSLSPDNRRAGSLVVCTLSHSLPQRRELSERKDEFITGTERERQAGRERDSLL